MGQRFRMNLRAFILRLREDRIYCGGGHIIVLDSLIFQSCHFCLRFFLNGDSVKWFGSSIDVLHGAFKIAHTYTFFDEKNFMDSRQFFALWFCDFLHVFMRIMQSENFATDIHTHYRQSETAPPYTRIICEKNFAPDIYENCGAFRICVSDWLSIGIFAFVCITFCICGHRLKSVVLLIDDVKIWL